MGGGLAARAAPADVFDRRGWWLLRASVHACAARLCFAFQLPGTHPPAGAAAAAAAPRKTSGPRLTNAWHTHAAQKITSKNAFDWNLIDYLSDICSTADSEIPCFSTLANVIDASGEIYAAKVDHLLHDAIKVRTDLSRSATSDAAQAGDDGDGEASGPARKSKAFSGNTIVKNVATINVNKLDLEFAVDPLFRKTSAAFDQGGARGLLLNHISSQGRCQLVFDSSDSVDTLGKASPQEEQQPPQQQSESTSPIDVSALQACMAESAWMAPGADGDAEVELCEAFTDFKFQGWTPSEEPAGPAEMDTMAVAVAPAAAPQAMTVETEYAADESDDDGMDMQFNQSFDDAGGPGPLDALFAYGDADADGPADGPAEPGAEARVTRHSARRQLGLLEDNEFNWLHGRKDNRGWHGEAGFSAPSKATTDAKKAAKPKKERFTIKFDEPHDWAKELGTSRAATKLAKSTLDAQTPSLLPEDLQFSVDALTTLFLLPSLKGKTLLTGANGDFELEGDDAGAAAADDWGAADVGVNDYAALSPSRSSASPTGDDFADFGGEGNDDNDDGDALPGNATPDPAAAEATAPTPASGSGGPLKLIQNMRQVEKINIKYAQKAKVMDIKKLKQHLWTEIAAEPKAPGTGAENQPEPGPGGRATSPAPKESVPAGAETFSNLWSEVPKKVTDKMADNLSVPIMFVTLLYLANDKELRIDGVEGMDNLIIQQKAEAV